MWTGIGIAAAGIGGALLGAGGAKSAANKQAAATEKAVDETSRQYDQGRSDLAPYREAGAAALGRLRALMGLDNPAPAGGYQWNGGTYSDRKSLRNAIEQNYRKESGGLDPFAPAVQSSIDNWMDRIAGGQEAAPSGREPAGDAPLLRRFSSSDLGTDPVYKSGLEFGLDEGTKAIERRAAAGGGYDSGATLKGLVRFGNDYGSTKANESYGRFTSDQDRTFGKLSGIAGMGSGATTVGVGASANEATNLSNLYTGGANAQGAATIAGSNALAGGVNSIGQYALLRQLTGGGQRTTTPSAVDPSVYQQG